MHDAPTRPRWWWYAPTALLIATACHQIVRTRTSDLAAWSGGGFGMFSTVDGWGNRHLEVIAIRPDVRRELEVPPELEETAKRMRALPSEPHARALAAALADAPSPDEGALAAIEVLVWSTDYDPVTLVPTKHLLRSFRIPFGER